MLINILEVTAQPLLVTPRRPALRLGANSGTQLRRQVGDPRIVAGAACFRITVAAIESRAAVVAVVGAGAELQRSFLDSLVVGDLTIFRRAASGAGGRLSLLGCLAFGLRGVGRGAFGLPRFVLIGRR